MFSNLTIKIIFWCVVILTICGVIPWIVLGTVVGLIAAVCVCVFIYVLVTEDKSQ